MARKLSPLAAEVSLNLNKWTAGIKQIDRDSRAITASLRPITDIGKQVGSAFAAAGLLVGGALLGMSKKAADFGDALFDMSQKTGISATQLAAYKLVAEQSGTSLESLSKGVNQLSKNIVAAATGSKEQAKVFAAMGIAVKDASGKLRDASDIMPEIAERFSKMEDGSLKTAIAMKLFGKAGADIIPVLNEGRAGFDKAAESIRKYGGNIEQVAILGNNFNDALGKSKAAMQGFSNAIGVALLPKLTELVLKGNEWIAVATKWANAHPELTMQIAKTSAALFGVGGLILGLTAIATLAPRVYEGVMLITSGFVKLGGAAAIAKGGVIGLAGAISTAVNLLPALALNKILPDPAQLGRNVRSIFDQALGLKSSVFEDPAQKGVPGLPENWIELSGKAKNATADWEKEMQKLLGAFEKTGKNAAGAKTQIQEMWESLKKESTEAASLEAVLMRAHNAHISLDQVTDKFGGTIKDVVAEMFKAGQTVLPDYIGKTYAQMKAQEALTAAAEEWQAVQQHTIDLFEKERQEWSSGMNRHEEVVVVLNDEAKARIEVAQAVGQHIGELKKVERSLEIEQRQLRATAATLIELSKAGYSAQQIQAMLGTTAEDLAIDMKALGVPMDAVTKKTLDQMAASQRLRDSWGDTFAAISDRLVDMIVDFDFSFKRLGDIAKDTAKSLLRSFLDGFLKPFKDGLAKMGEGLANTLSGVLFGGGQQGGGIFSGLGGVLGGIFGSKGSAGAATAGAGAAIGGTPPFVAGGIGGMSGHLTGLASKLNPIMMGASIANDAFDLATKITGKIGAGRDSANEVIKSQNAFEATLDAILKDTALSPTNKFKQVGNAWEGFQANLGRFSAAGGEGGVTANQAFATVSPLVSQIQTDLIKDGASDGSTGNGGDVTVNLYLTDVHSPEEFIEWLKFNRNGIREEIARGVQLTNPAVVSR